ncbi:hypothetical protein [Mesobacillus harenae]|uniref:hypothetical protein n=1 Tax=Mesobacillus harenae TaxID=2213203 RepID=UPI00158053BE|nr:hypothetical protein [Mesobacillus harenae]
MIARWLTVNLIIVLLIAGWGAYQGFESNYVLFGKLVAQVGFVLFLINLNMYFVFLLIRKSKIRAVKVRLAKISKRMMKYHVAIAVSATALIGIHAATMLYANYGSLLKAKTGSGIFLSGVLGVLLFSGLLRRWKSSGPRRRFHYRMAFIFFGLLFLHIFI